MATFHLFCQVIGPADVHFVWEKDGRELEMCVPVQTHTLPDGGAHALSWLRDTVRESTDYRCSAISAAGRRSSHVRVSVMPRGVPHPEAGSQELAAWRAAAGEHGRMMQRWTEAWESCKDTL